MVQKIVEEVADAEANTDGLVVGAQIVVVALLERIILRVGNLVFVFKVGVVGAVVFYHQLDVKVGKELHANAVAEIVAVF